MHDLVRPTLVVVPILCLALSGVGCGRSSTSSTTVRMTASAQTGTYGGYSIPLPSAESRSGIAVVILLDTSGSMAQLVRDQKGVQRSKDQIAREDVQKIIEQLAEWKKKHPDRDLQLGLGTFSGDVNVLLPVEAFDAAKAQQALKQIRTPNGGTAIGRALEEAAKGLYRSGRTRKFIVCITDGENTSGIEPNRVVRQLQAQTQGGINYNFVAFDTKAKQFAFLREVKGHVVEAADGAQLQTELAKIYETRILAESPDEAEK